LAATSYETGLAAAQRGRHQEARAAFEAAAQNGVAEAHFQLGLMHAFGRGAPRSEEAAIDCFIRGAEGGSANAAYAYALTILDADRTAAERWLLAASEANHPPAMTRLAELVSDRDPATARALLGRAAQAGHVEAMAAYGHALALGVGGPEDQAEGLAWLYAGAALGAPEPATKDVLVLARVMQADAIEAAQKRGRALAKQFRKRG
jgi:TPR repeat protein